MSEKPTLDDWRELAAKDLKGADPDTLVWQTPEGIEVKPLYTATRLGAKGTPHRRGTRRGSAGRPASTDCLPSG